MKELIAISAYCPTPEKKKILLELILKLQEYRDQYDLLIVSHSPIGETITELVDYVFYDRSNDILEDFNLTNGFTFENPDFLIISSLVFSKSTHVAVYSLICNAINFAKFNGYEKVHYVEYDFLPINLGVINEASEILKTHDTFFIRQFDTEWVHGPYFSFRVNNLPMSIPTTKIMIIDELYANPSKHTEHIFTKLLSENRKVYNYDFNNLANHLGKLDRVDSHEARSLNWVVPLYNSKFDCLELFIYNEHGGNHTIGVSINGKMHNYQCPIDSNWVRAGLSNMDLPLNLQIYVNGKITKTVELTANNIESFKNKNKIIFKQHD